MSAAELRKAAETLRSERWPSGPLWPALADWLDAMAAIWDGGGKNVFGHDPANPPTHAGEAPVHDSSLMGRALTLARLINGAPL